MVSIAKLNLAGIKSSEYLSAKIEIECSGKKVTDKGMENYIEANIPVREAKEKLRALEVRLKGVKDIIQSLFVSKDAALELSKKQRSTAHLHLTSNI